MNAKLNATDFTLLDLARKAIQRNYDPIHFNHTVGAAVRCKNGNIYTGVNVYSMHGACAEVIALGNAITQGEREFDCIVAVCGEKGEEILPPCGNCRQMLFDYAPACMVIIEHDGQLQKIPCQELLPFPYENKE